MVEILNVLAASSKCCCSRCGVHRGDEGVVVVPGPLVVAGLGTIRYNSLISKVWVSGAWAGRKSLIKPPQVHVYLLRSLITVQTRAYRRHKM